MKVRAQDGLQCPMEGKPREYITDAADGTDVPDSVYYRRLVDEGSLVIVPTAAAGKAAKKEEDTKS